MNLKKRTCAWLLALAMLLGQICVPVLADGVPFTASAGTEALSVVKSDTDYTYTEIIYDASWTPVGSEDHSVPLYTVTVPEGTASVTLDFGAAARLAYAYTAAGDYASACGEYGDGTVGQTTAAVTDFAQFIRVQTPYDASWHSEFLYAVGFTGDGATGGTGEASGIDPELLITMLGADYAEKVDDWEIISAGMYETLCHVTPDPAAVRARINAVARRVSGSTLTDADAAKAILALRSSGLDPTNLIDSHGRRINLVSLLNATTTTSIYHAPYVLLAYQQGDYGAEKEEALRAFLLENQNADGSWAGTPDTTGIVMASLAAYAGDTAVDTAMANGKNYLLGSISAAGTCASIWSSDNADTTAMAVIGLAAAGVDPSAACAPGGKSVAEGLMSFALSDYSGFGYTDTSARNEFATKDGFWGALCVKFGAGTRLFDFTGNAAAPAVATRISSSGGTQTTQPTQSTQPEEEKTITVTFSVTGSSGTWLSAQRVTAAENATAMEVLRQVLDGNAAFSYSESGGYLRSVTYNGTTAGEFTEGSNSGWKYTVNGEAPMVGMGSYTLAAGDRLNVYFVKDDTTDTTPNQGGETFDNPPGGTSETDPTEPAPAVTDPTEPAPETPTATFTDTQGHPAQMAIEFCRAKGIMSGTGADTFSPDATLSRAMLITVLYNLEGKPTAEGAAFPDVPDGAWYAAPIGWAVQAGLCSGYGSGLFGPENDVSLEQLDIILSRYVQYKQQDATFTMPGNTFDGVTRGQIAQMLMEYLQKTT